MEHNDPGSSSRRKVEDQMSGSRLLSNTFSLSIPPVSF
jgi:hypothetical protein